MATSNNAPMPDPEGPAQVFDSTIEPAPPTVSSVGGTGPSPTEAAVHSGASNGIDPYLHAQFIATETPTWSTSHAPCTLLFAKPIHPATSHQYIAHLSRMYNVYSGGIDYGVKLCGTGFHAGALAVARLPPNIDPGKVNSLQDLTAFEYKVIDPKTLEVVLQSVIDQRNVMYHYLPLDRKNPQSFGGYIAIYVMVPLNTSSSGSSQIAIQIFEKPSVNFAFNQLRPLDLDVVLQTVPREIESSLDFTINDYCYHAHFVNDLISYPKTSKPFITFEACYGYGFDGQPMMPNVTKAMIDSHHQNWYHKYDRGAFKTSDEFATMLSCHISDEVFPMIGEIDATIWDNDKFMGGQMRLVEFLDGPGLEPLVKDTIISKVGMGNEGEAIGVFRTTKWVEKQSPNSWAPAVQENLVVFSPNTSWAEVVQPKRLADQLSTGKYAGLISPQESLIFNLIDTNLEVPVSIFRLTYQGFFTTLPSNDIVKWNLSSGHYRFAFLGIQRQSIALLSIPGALPRNQYARNRALSRLVV